MRVDSVSQLIKFIYSNIRVCLFSESESGFRFRIYIQCLIGTDSVNPKKDLWIHGALKCRERIQRIQNSGDKTFLFVFSSAVIHNVVAYTNCYNFVIILCSHVFCSFDGHFSCKITVDLFQDSTFVYNLLYSDFRFTC